MAKISFIYYSDLYFTVGMKVLRPKGRVFIPLNHTRTKQKEMLVYCLRLQQPL